MPKLPIYYDWRRLKDIARQIAPHVGWTELSVYRGSRPGPVGEVKVSRRREAFDLYSECPPIGAVFMMACLTRARIPDNQSHRRTLSSRHALGCHLLPSANAVQLKSCVRVQSGTRTDTEPGRYACFSLVVGDLSATITSKWKYRGSFLRVTLYIARAARHPSSTVLHGVLKHQPGCASVQADQSLRYTE